MEKDEYYQRITQFVTLALLSTGEKGSYPSKIELLEELRKQVTSSSVFLSVKMRLAQMSKWRKD